MFPTIFEHAFLDDVRGGGCKHSIRPVTKTVLCTCDMDKDCTKMQWKSKVSVTDLCYLTCMVWLCSGWCGSGFSTGGLVAAVLQ